MTVVRSPLRYPGGKAKLFPFIAELIEANGLHNCSYKEPYAGGAGLALNLLFSGFAKSIHLNDVDPALFSFWWSVVHRNREFQARVKNIVFSIDEWHAQKEIWSSPDTSSELDLGFATYYLNRTNRSGIIEGAGPIGGYDQNGPYKMDARFSMSEQLTIINLIGTASNVIEVSNYDAINYISEKTGGDLELVYLDPPYYIKGQRLYRNSYSHDDHKAIADLMKSRTGNWMVSYDDVEEIRSLYEWSEPITIFLQYSAGPVMLGKEVLFLSDGLKRGRIDLAA